MNERLVGKIVDSIRKEGDTSVICFSDQAGITVNTAVSAHLVAEENRAEVISFREHDTFYRITLVGSSYIDISKENASHSPEIFAFRDTDGQYVIE